MNTTTTVTTKGQVTIPEFIRRALDISVGDKVAFTRIIRDNRQVMIKIIPSKVVEDLFGSIKTPFQVTDHSKVRKATAHLLGQKYKI